MTPIETKLMQQAVEFATWVHMGQVRKYNGFPYVTHPYRCSNRAFMLTADCEIAIAMLLHDGPEDQPERCPLSLVKALYGKRVAELVGSLTNPSKVFKNANRAERKAIDRAHYMTASAIVKSCKCIDRLDNLNEMSIEQDPGFARLYCDESEQLVDVLRQGDMSVILDNLIVELTSVIHRLRNQLGTLP